MSNPGDRFDYRLLPDDYQTEYDRDKARENIENWFLDAVKVGLDVQVKLGGDRITTWNLSDYLGECVREDKPLLLRACYLAMDGRDDQATAAALRKFVEQVAKHHAEDEIS